MTTIGTIQDRHFRGGANLNEGSRNNPTDPILEEILTAVKTDMIAVELAATDIGSPAVAQLIFAGQPSDDDDLVIGADTYTFQSAGTSSNIDVTIGGTAEATIDNLVLAINGTTPEGESTENLIAEKIGTTICCIRSADAPGGTAIGADPDIAIDASGATNVSADVGDVNMNTLAGKAAVQRQFATAQLTITTAMITATTVRVAFPFTPTMFHVTALSSGVPVTFTADAFAIDGDDIEITLGTDLANGDVVTVTAYE